MSNEGAQTWQCTHPRCRGSFSHLPRPTLFDDYKQLSDLARYVRVLVVEPGVARDAVYCELIEVELEAAKQPSHHGTQYEALSYRWQDVANSEPDLRRTPHIHIRGRELWVFPVSHTVIEALYVFRHPDQPRYLWIDQICINQKSVSPTAALGGRSEKDIQVGAMGEIYKSAAGVLIWLGVEETCDAPALEVLRQFGALLEGVNKKVDEVLAGTSTLPSLTSLFQTMLAGSSNDTREAKAIFVLSTGVMLASGTLQNLGITAASGLPESGEIPWSHVLRFFEKSWFLRAWPVQEVVLSGLNKTVYCGSKLPCIKWEYIGFFAVIAKTHPKYLAGPGVPAHEPMETAVDIYQYALRYNGKGFTLLPLLQAMRSFDSADPRDKVYALLNMVDFELGTAATDTNLLRRPKELLPNYSVANTADRVNCETAVYLLQRDRTLGVLMFSKSPQGIETACMNGGITSWAPQWTRGVERVNPILTPFKIGGSSARGEDRGFSVCGRFIHLEEGDMNYGETTKFGGVIRRTLSLRGVQVGGIVESVSSVLPRLQMRLNKGEEALKEDYAAIFRCVDEVVDWARKAYGSVIEEELLSRLALTFTAGSTGFQRVVKERGEGMDDMTKTVDEHVEDFAAFLLGQSREISTVSKAMDELIRWLMSRQPSKYEGVGADWARKAPAPCRGRRLFRVQGSSMVGLGPSSMAFGDRVYIFRGGRVPFVVRDSNLRPSNPGLLVGHAYLDGAMDGEFACELDNAELVELV